MKTEVVILNWNTRDYLARFIPPLKESLEGLDAEIVVADSASTDSSAELVQERFPDIRLIKLEQNFGFTGGYNRAFAELLDRPAQEKPQYLVLMNSDILVDKDWLRPLVEYMDSHPDCAVCGPALCALDCRDGEYFPSGKLEYAGAAGGLIDRYGFPFCRGRVLGRTDRFRPEMYPDRDVLWVSGACMMVRASVWEKLGGLDDRFFAHMEEIDFCWRAWTEGFRVRALTSSRVYHIGGGTLPKTSPDKLRLNYRNGLLLLENNLPYTLGTRKARCRIRTRAAIDCMAAVCYLLMGKVQNFKAVCRAHKEWRKLRLEPHPQVHPAEAAGRPAGFTDICIIPVAALKGKRIFAYISSYENRH